MSDHRKPCTCDGAGRGPGRECVVKRGQRLGELWRCSEGREPPDHTPAAAPSAPAPAEVPMPEPVAEVCSSRLRWHLPERDSDPIARFLNNDTHLLCAVSDAIAYAAAREAAERERCLNILRSVGPDNPRTVNDCIDLIIAGDVR